VSCTGQDSISYH